MSTQTNKEPKRVLVGTIRVLPEVGPILKEHGLKLDPKQAQGLADFISLTRMILTSALQDGTVPREATQTLLAEMGSKLDPALFKDAVAPSALPKAVYAHTMEVNIGARYKRGNEGPLELLLDTHTKGDRLRLLAALRKNDPVAATLHLHVAPKPKGA